MRTRTKKAFRGRNRQLITKLRDVITYVNRMDVRTHDAAVRAGANAILFVPNDDAALRAALDLVLGRTAAALDQLISFAPNPTT